MEKTEGQCEGKCRVTFAKVRNYQSLISGKTDFSLMESCGVSAPNYQTKSLCGILIIQSQNVPANMFSTCMNKLHYVCVFVVYFFTSYLKALMYSLLGHFFVKISIQFHWVRIAVR